MAEDPRLILHFKTRAKFEQKLNDPNDDTINPNKHFVIISDSRQFWVRGQYIADNGKLDDINEIYNDWSITQADANTVTITLKGQKWNDSTRTWETVEYPIDIKSADPNYSFAGLMSAQDKREHDRIETTNFGLTGITTSATTATINTSRLNINTNASGKTDVEIPSASSEDYKAGLQSAADKVKEDRITGVNYKLSESARTSEKITLSLDGINPTDNTSTAENLVPIDKASQSLAGLMTATDKKAIDNLHASSWSHINDSETFTPTEDGQDVELNYTCRETTQDSLSESTKHIAKIGKVSATRAGVMTKDDYTMLHTTIPSRIDNFNLAENTDSGKIVTDITQTSGQVAKSKELIKNIKLTDYTSTGESESLQIAATDTIEGAFNKVETYIKGLDLSQVGGDGKYVQWVKQDDGKVTANTKDLTATNVANTAITASDTQVGLAGTNVQTTIGNIATAIKTVETALNNKNVAAEGDNYVNAGASNNKVTVATQVADLTFTEGNTTTPTNSTLVGTTNKLVKNDDVATKVSNFVNARIKEEIAKLDAPVRSGLDTSDNLESGKHVGVKVVETDGKLESVLIKETNIASESELKALIKDIISGDKETVAEAKTKLATLNTAGYGTLYDVASKLKTFLEDTDTADATINKWKEIKSFLDGITDTDTLLGIVNDAVSGLESTINGKAVTNVAYDATNKKFTKTINGVPTDIVTASTIITDGGAATSDQGAKADSAIQTIQIDGTAQTKTNGVVNLPAYPTVMTGASSTANGVSGLVPQPNAEDQDKVLKGNGTWGTVSTTDTKTSATLWGQSLTATEGQTITGAISNAGNITSLANNTYSLGSIANRWKGVYGGAGSFTTSVTSGKYNITDNGDIITLPVFGDIGNYSTIYTGSPSSSSSSYGRASISIVAANIRTDALYRITINGTVFENLKFYTRGAYYFLSDANVPANNPTSLSDGETFKIYRGSVPTNTASLLWDITTYGTSFSQFKVELILVKKLNPAYLADGVTADGLTNSVSLWGNSFNGTSNISGSLSNVGNIYFNPSTTTKVIGHTSQPDQRPSNICSNGAIYVSSYSGLNTATVDTLAMTQIQETGIHLKSTTLSNSTDGTYHNNPRVRWWICNPQTAAREGSWYIGPTWDNSGENYKNLAVTNEDNFPNAKFIVGQHLQVNKTSSFLGYADFQSGAGNSGSDIRFKENITPTEDVLDKINQLEVIDYTWNKEGEAKRETFGISAQQLEELGFNNMVHTRDDEDETKWVEYDRFGVLAIKAIQELTEIVEKQQDEIDKLKSLLS